MYSTLIHDMHKNTTLVPEQFGYKNGISTKTDAFKRNVLLESAKKKTPPWKRNI